jgi:dephospho-CoA kinase
MISAERLHGARSTVRWKHGVMPVIGLTGGVGGGKSEVAGILVSAGFRVIDADSMGHQLLEIPEVRRRLVFRFGDGILERAEGTACDRLRRIDRKSLAAIVFADERARHDLEAIVHPLMRSRFIESIAQEGQGINPSPVVLDAAILLEAGWDDLCDEVVFVDSPRPDRMRRVSVQRGWSADDFEARERAQWPCDIKRRRAGLVITNDCGIESLRREVSRMVCRLREPAWQPEELTASSASARAHVPSSDPVALETPVRGPTKQAEERKTNLAN